MLHEPAFTLAPVDQQVLGQKHRADHAQPVVHPAGCQELTHGSVDDGDAGAAFLPGRQPFGVLAPWHRFGFRAERLAAGYPWVADQNMSVELAPEQFADPGDGPGIAAVELAAVGGDGGVQALAR